MDRDEIKDLVKRKRFLIESFFYSISQTIPKIEARDSALRMGVTGHFLQSVIMELIIKILYELDIKKTAPFSHDIFKIFKKLNQETQYQVISEYDKARNRREAQFKVHGITDVQFHPLEKVLRNNEQTIKNFKYDTMGNNSNSSLDGIFLIEIFKIFDLKVRQFGE